MILNVRSRIRLNIQGHFDIFSYIIGDYDLKSMLSDIYVQFFHIFILKHI